MNTAIVKVPELSENSCRGCIFNKNRFTGVGGKCKGKYMMKKAKMGICSDDNFIFIREVKSWN